MKDLANIPPKTANDRFTDDQWQAIHQSGDNILVAASAGSGKTTVLVQRIIEKIKNGVHVDELLVVTFTESAASEMKERIQTAIQDAINTAVTEEQYRHLLRQTTLLPQANISTIHAFCLKVIQRFFYLIEIDPVFRMMGDAIEIDMLKEDVWEDLKETLYGEPGTFFKSLAKAYSGDRNDEGLKDLIFSLYNFSRANPEPVQWLSQLINLYEMEEGLEKSSLYQDLLKPQIERDLDGILYDLDAAIHMAGEGEGTVKQRDLLESERAHVWAVREAIDQDDYEAGFDRLEQLSFATWPRSKKDDPDKEVKAQMKNLRDKSKKAFTTLKDAFFNRSKQDQEWVIRESKPYVAEMIRVTKRFTDAYWNRKLSGNMLDFNDLEHLTLEILLPLKDGKRGPSEASRYYRQKFQEVLIDEYQDVNKLQERILYGVTRHHPDTENLFMVGDVKQSIYAFRLADPGLFLEKYEKFGQSQGGERIILADNFRSRGEVLSFTNFVFTQLMDKKVGQMDYDELAELKQGNQSFPEAPQCETEIIIYLKGEGQRESEQVAELTFQGDPELDWGIDDKATGEVTMVAQKIRDLVQNQVLLYDKRTKSERPISYKDIVLLTPTKKNNLLILETFKEYGVPVILNDSQSFFQRTEITVILSLLKVIDNPRQDIPLAAVLRSPIVGLNERQLAAIRLSSPYGDFYDAVSSFVASFAEREATATEEEQEGYRKLTLFLQQLRNWRQSARHDNLVSLIWRIYEETHFLDYVGGMTAGKQRAANLHSLYERAKKYEKTNYKGLFQFIRFIERIQERYQDLAEPTTFSEDEDAIRIMTIHASKGLEFPVVFVMDMSKSFNMQDIRGRYLFSEEYGIGTDLFDSDNRMRYPSLTTYALANEKKKQLLAEEMRKLYVALTRAEQKLFLVGTYESKEKMWQEWGAVDETADRVIPDHLRLNANNLMKWVGLSLYRHGSVRPDSEIKLYRGELANDPVSFSISFQGEEDLLGNFVTVDLEEEVDWDERITSLATNSVKESATASERDYQMAVRLMEATYPHEMATRTTSYQSVSEIKRLFEDPDNAQLLQLEFGQQEAAARYVEPELARPTFLQEETRPSNAEIGTAVHYVMQNLNIAEPVTEPVIEDLIQNLVERGSIKEKVASLINHNQIVQFFTTELGKRLQADAHHLKREVPFTMLMRASNIFEGIQPEANDHILIHGIIDGFIEYPDHILLFDFKTDYVGENLKGLLDKYRGQMIVYREALEDIKKKKVTETYLCFLSTNENVLVE
ncbi:helicase-exonuclease AddAB subunit AddA [Jeotgalibaca caeni]|uniref:helicase-exonuclease AddAB subunit AddA n=1 Tax=Jeotgalibaca caeni TaxID=3028623 RepID=UPI00237D7FD1|nr:helicase-exonuclease AddAB subunit AddA [Jeotgalibaca caeni]MDE1548786.1 helicase-exonuclease AddAB subunit AddA [Jeotgalibaca caeni]